MTIAVGGRNLPIGAVVAAIGGAVAAVGTFLAWETLDSAVASALGESSAISGISSGLAGKVAAVLAIAAIALAVIWIMGIKLPIPPFKAYGFLITSTEGLIVLAGALCLLAGIWGFLGITKDVNDANALVPGIGAMGMGIFVSIAGAVVIVVGGLLGTLNKTA